VTPAPALDVRPGTPAGGAGDPHPVSLGSGRASAVSSYVGARRILWLDGRNSPSPRGRGTG